VKAVVVGGGAVGLCVAEALAVRDIEVTTIERDRCGLGASAGNAGWITPSLAIPVPGPGVIGQSLRWLVNPGGPLWIRPTLSPAMLRWVTRFLLSCRRQAYRRGLIALQTAASRAAQSFERLAESGVVFEYHHDDLLYPAFSRPELDHLIAVAAQLRGAGAVKDLVQASAADLIQREPALSDQVVGGLVAGGERRVRPESLTYGLRQHLIDRGAQVTENAAVKRLTRSGSGCVVETTGGEHRADVVVLAAGTATSELLAPHGFNLPLAAAKGYSRTFGRVPSGPANPLYLEAPKVAISVYDGGVRVSGTLELGAQTLALSPRRLEAITAAAKQALPRWELPAVAHDWAGMRSMSPDGLPYIGALPGLDCVYAAAGHATLGITLAPLTGELLGGLIAERIQDPLLKAFDPARALRPSKYRQLEGHDEGRERSDRHPLRLGSDR
jgi:D-amino-acid dehydrogenase